MGMGWQVIDAQGEGSCRADRHHAVSAGIAYPVLMAGIRAEMNGHASLQVGKIEVARPVAAELRAEQREERTVLRYLHELPVAECPLVWRIVESENADLPKERFGHDLPPAIGWIDLVGNLDHFSALVYLTEFTVKKWQKPAIYED